MSNSPFLGRVRVKVTYPARSFPPFKSAVDAAFSAASWGVLIGAIHLYFRLNGFHEKMIGTLILFALAIYAGILVTWYILAKTLQIVPRLHIPLTILTFISALAVFYFAPGVLYQAAMKYDEAKPFIDLDAATHANLLVQYAKAGLHVWFPTAILIPFLLTISFYKRSA
jgi:glucan phosphoethanolaminetransferase (alkaline phosphatase superfamily)